MDHHFNTHDRKREAALPDWQAGSSFLVENPELYGAVFDAYPVAMGDLLLGVNGTAAEDGAPVPSFAAEEAGVEGLLNTVYGQLLPPTEETAAVLRGTFGDRDEEQEYPVARYSAALAEAVALYTFRGPARGTSYEQTSLMLGSEIARKLSILRDTIERLDSDTQADDSCYTVSFGACRILRMGEGRYTLEIFAAGNFRLYLLDREGMSPLWTAVTPCIDPDSNKIVSGCRVPLLHPEPFAVLLLSDGVCGYGAAEERALQENAGMRWACRMRLEDHILRLVTACVRPAEFGERAERFFTGRSVGRGSASGAICLCLDADTSYETFREACQHRYAELEAWIAGLPNGYDPDDETSLPTREDMEKSFSRYLMESRPTLVERVTRAIGDYAVRILHGAPRVDELPYPDGVSDLLRLDYGEVNGIYARYDAENRADREQLADNVRLLRELLSENWITLRPQLRPLYPDGDAAHERTYRHCVQMNRRLYAMLENRRRMIGEAEARLTRALDTLRACGEDATYGRGGDVPASAWLSTNEGDVLSLTQDLRRLEAEGEDYRTLWVAYTAERDTLFSLDTMSDKGFFAADFTAIRIGELSDDGWERLREALSARRGEASGEGLWDAVRAMSAYVRVLRDRIDDRDAEGRMAREISRDYVWQMACIRAAIYGDAHWGDDVATVLDESARHEYLAAVARHREQCELAERKKSIYESYRRLYERYETSDTVL